MRGLAFVLVSSLALPGCLLYFDDGGKSSCNLLDEEPAIAAAQRNPELLTCESFGGGTCDPKCGPCPAAEGAALAPLPSWGFCGSSCEALGEAECGARDDCRVVKDARCAIGLDCTTDFLGCFPTDQLVDPSVECTAAPDGETCSRNPACTAYHRVDPCPLDGPCPREFALCMPEGTSPGQCFAEALCDRVPPPCPSGTTPSIANGCYTNACIPLDLCEAAPPMPL